MSNKELEIAIKILLGIGGVIGGVVVGVIGGINFDKIKHFFFPFKLKEQEEQILFTFLDKKVEIIKNHLNELLSKLIKGKDFLKKIENKIKSLKSKEKNIKQLLSSKKKFFS